MKIETLKKLVKDGRVECTTDISQYGRVEIRWTATGKRETVNVK